MTPRETVVVMQRRQPLELCFAMLGVCIAVAYAFGAPRSPSLNNALDPRGVITWAVLILLGGLFVLVPQLPFIRRDDIVLSVGLEMSGNTLLAGASGMLLTAMAVQGGWRALTTGGVVLVWGVGSLWRALQLRADFMSVRAVIREEREQDVAGRLSFYDRLREPDDSESLRDDDNESSQ